MSDKRSFTLGPFQYFVGEEGDVWRSGIHGASPRHPVSDAEVRAFARAYLEMEDRANEYHDTTMRQAKRIAELESACKSYQLRILDLERVLTADQRKGIDCPCGDGPGHGKDWCADYLNYDEVMAQP